MGLHGYTDTPKAKKDGKQDEAKLDAFDFHEAYTSVTQLQNAAKQAAQPPGQIPKKPSLEER